jgi:branched-chain amino acid transport system substrate-binding protein
MDRRTLIASLTAAALPLPPALASAQASTYKIGVTYPLTGPLAPSGRLTLLALEQSVEDINKAGGVKGHPLALDIEDTKSSPEGGVAAMRKLVQVDGCAAVVTIYTNVVTAQIPLADQLRVPTLSTVESPGLVSKSQFSFAHSQTIAEEAPLLHDYWKFRNYKRLYALYGNNALGLLIQPAVKEAALGDRMAYAESFFDLDATDFRGIAAKLKDFNPDAIFIAAQGSTAEQTMIKQVRELNTTAPMFSPSNTYNEAQWRNGVGAYADTVQFAGLNLDENGARDFIRAYEARSGGPHPTYFAAEAYDLIQMYAYCIARGGYTGEGIRNALATLKGVHSILGGTITMGADHYSLNGAISLWQPQGGKLVKAAFPRSH